MRKIENKQINDKIDESELKKINNRQFAASMKNSSLLNSMKNLSNDLYKSKTLQRSHIRKYMEDPYKNSDSIQGVSELMRHNNGILKELILYKSDMLTYDHFITTIDPYKYKTIEAHKKANFEAAKQINKYNLKFNCKWIGERIISKGEVYIYKIENKDNIILQEIPSNLCIMTKNINGIKKYAIKLSGITENTKTSFPIEIQDLYHKYKEGLLDSDKNLLSNGYYQLDKNVVAFNLDYWSYKGIPYYAHLFDDLMSISDMKDLQDVNAKVENFKLLVQKALVDDNGDLLQDDDDITNYHLAAKSILPPGIGIVTTPMEIKPIVLGDSKAKTMEYLNSLEEGLYSAAGVNDGLFNGGVNNSEAVSLGFKVDKLLSLRIMKMIENWVNEDMKNSSKTKNWQLTFLPMSEIDRDNFKKSCKEDIAMGGSRKIYLAACGLTPLQVANLLKDEEMLELHKQMIPQQSSHTQSSSDVGRPSNSDSDNTELTTGQSNN